jgi:hypothetical protein
MLSYRRICSWALFFLTLTGISCKNSTNHYGVTDPHRSLLLQCEPAGANVSCRALLMGVGGREVTTEAGWYFSGSPVGHFAQPGLFVPTGTGDVGLRASFEDLTSLPYWFFVDPPRSSGTLDVLTGLVSDAISNRPISGAEVRILDGHSAGALAITASTGVYSFDRILDGQTFTITASKVGYEPETKTYRVDFPRTTPDSGLDFSLRPL